MRTCIGINARIILIPYANHSKEDGNDHESIQSSNTPDPGHHMAKKTQENITHKNAKMSAFSQQLITRLDTHDR